MNSQNNPSPSSCVVAFPIACNRATGAPNNATSCATPDATPDLLSLSARVLGRVQRNHERNLPATDELRSDITNATLIETNATEANTKLHGFSINELQRLAGDDWDGLKDNPSTLNTFALILYEQKQMHRGEIPARFTAHTYCAGCKKTVNVPPALVNNGKILGCSWCHVR